MAALEALDVNGPPLNIVQLEERIAAIADALDVPTDRARVYVCSVIVAQMLPAGTVVKGGIGVKLRLGEVGTRATKDVDVVAQERDTFLADLAERLDVGWGRVPSSKGALKRDPDAPPRLAFSGKARADRQPQPGGVPQAYLMEPYKVTLHFMGSPWRKVPLEVAHDEIGGLEYADYDSDVPDQLAAIGRALGCGALEPVPLISLEQQLAQKIHAASAPDSDRAHDLVDIQLLWRAGTADGQGLDLPLLADLCRRTFAYRNTHAWPPAASMPDLLQPAYERAREEADSGIDPESGAPVLEPTLTRATAWLELRIAEIEEH